MKPDTNSTVRTRSLRLTQTLFGLAIVIVMILVAIGIAGVAWPKWLLAITTVL